MTGSYGLLAFWFRLLLGLEDGVPMIGNSCWPRTGSVLPLAAGSALGPLVAIGPKEQ
jgi:hypothetical protein